MELLIFGIFGGSIFGFSAYYYFRGFDKKLLKDWFIFIIILFSSMACYFGTNYFGIRGLVVPVIIGMAVFIAMLKKGRDTFDNFHKIVRILFVAGFIILCVLLLFILLQFTTNFQIFTYIPPINFKDSTLLTYLSTIFALLSLYMLVDLIELSNVAEPDRIRKMILIITLIVAVILGINISLYGTVEISQISGKLTGGQIGGVDLDIDPLSDVLFAVTSNPLISLVIVMMVMGAIVKVSGLRGAEGIGNILIVFIPLAIWSLIVIGYIPVPQYMLNLFPEFQWFGWFLFVIMTVTIFIMVILVISVMSEATRVKINLG